MSQGDKLINFLDLHREIVAQYYKPYYAIKMDGQLIFCDLEGKQIEDDVLELQKKKMSDFITNYSEPSSLAKFINDELGGAKIYYRMFSFYCDNSPGIKTITVDDVIHKRAKELQDPKFYFFNPNYTPHASLANIGQGAVIGEGIEFEDVALEFNSNYLLFNPARYVPKAEYATSFSIVLKAYDNTGNRRKSMKIDDTGFVVLTGDAENKSLIYHNGSQTLTFPIHDHSHLGMSPCRRIIYNTAVFYPFDDQMRLKEIAEIVHADLQKLNLKMIAAIQALAASNSLTPYHQFFTRDMFPMIYENKIEKQNWLLHGSDYCDIMLLLNICEVEKGKL